ncbi:hypothetical protein RRG08_032839 [Elysia crispata]|uniref:Apple domain-containing protein n=1 Tax=Elysia crispata TaxID=231223 RepID=A0AAE1AEZ1_9GAST|nr:hypothetical protein RRG08_032839 [Elysia crispata]
MTSRTRFTLWLFLNILAHHICNSQRLVPFTLTQGLRISSGATAIEQTSGPKTLLRCAALCGADCGMFHYSSVNGICVIFAERYFESGLVFTSDADWTIGSKIYPVLTKDEWTLAFRGQKEIGVQVWDTWSATGVHDDNYIPTGFPHACLRMNHYASCDRHFRSHILDNWVNIQEVYMSWIKDNTEVAYVVFDGTGTSRDSWFTATRILDSTWAPSIINDTSILFQQSIKGYCNGDSCRRFYLHGPHAHCTVEWSYSYVLDRLPDWCQIHGFWEPRLNDSVPVFMYSPTEGRTAMGTNHGYPLPDTGDILAIWVKFA